uniref:Uncharacterized protein n=1 Tax=Ananas comosus var. bracteatus TaxID=296719 RepID=A0A6V7P915_ANACO|nr:unnamed protein product [Ananas comosus var. bracteatus]
MRFQCDEVTVFVWTVLELDTVRVPVLSDLFTSIGYSRGGVRCSLGRQDKRIAIPREFSPPATLGVRCSLDRWDECIAVPREFSPPATLGVWCSLNRRNGRIAIPREFSPLATLGVVYGVVSTDGTSVSQSQRERNGKGAIILKFGEEFGESQYLLKPQKRGIEGDGGA